MPANSTKTILETVLKVSPKNEDLLELKLEQQQLPRIIYRQPQVFSLADFSMLQPFYDLLKKIDSITRETISPLNKDELLKWRVKAYDITSYAVIDWQRRGGKSLVSELLKAQNKMQALLNLHLDTDVYNSNNLI